MFGFRFGWVVCVKLFVWLKLVCFVGYFDLRGGFGWWVLVCFVWVGVGLVGSLLSLCFEYMLLRWFV